MNGEIMHEVLTKLNRRLSSASRSVALLMDNAGCHPPELKGKYSNIKIIFLPPNTTSHLQPLDLGIIQNFKVHYRKLLLRFVISKIDQTTSDTASQIVKSINVLQAIRWVAEAWDSVSQEFRKAGITDSNFSVASRQFDDDDDDDPFADLDLPSLVEQISAISCSVDEYINGEDDVPVCMEYSDDWEEHFFQNLGTDSLATEDAEEEEDQYDVEPPPPKIAKYEDAISALEDVQRFLDNKGHSEQATNISSMMNKVTELHCVSLSLGRQSTLQDYFHPL